MSGSSVRRYVRRDHRETVRRPYIQELLPDVLEGRIRPDRVLDRTVDLDGVPGGYLSAEAPQIIGKAR